MNALNNHIMRLSEYYWIMLPGFNNYAQCGIEYAVYMSPTHVLIRTHFWTYHVTMPGNPPVWVDWGHEDVVHRTLPNSIFVRWANRIPRHP
jgi:hypothetical protein